ncbi:hypothetical protein TNCV_2226971 [Trichonephila clavipes]|uniref:Uncharacterized protein n=1 Tax=Trichonephila clavipes TaxID=2585209 RepID=A0A8X6WE93_TRICX|nr:hypothetical protein TNCV_2226971 [Trichonephila clavipes]
MGILPQNWGGIDIKCTVTSVVLEASDQAINIIVPSCLSKMESRHERSGKNGAHATRPPLQIHRYGYIISRYFAHLVHNEMDFHLTGATLSIGCVGIE